MAQNTDKNTWVEKYRTPTQNLNFAATEWKQVMTTLLLSSEIIHQNDVQRLKCDSKIANPVVVMDLRHEMARNGNAKKISSAKEDILTEARKLVRQENMDRIKQERETRIVNKEIEQLRENLTNQRMLNRINNDVGSKTEKSLGLVKTDKKLKRYSKMWKRMESYNACVEIDNWMKHKPALPPASKCVSSSASLLSIDNTQPLTITVTNKQKMDNCSETDSDKGSECRSSSSKTTEINPQAIKPPGMWSDSKLNGKREIMEKFFQSSSDIFRIKTMLKEGMFNYKNNANRAGLTTQACNSVCGMCTAKEDTEYIDSKQNTTAFTSSEITHCKLKTHKTGSLIDLQNLRFYWEIWRSYIKLKKTQKAKEAREIKIESFLKRLEENKGEIATESLNKITNNTHKSNKQIKQRIVTAPHDLQSKIQRMQVARKCIMEKNLDLVDFDNDTYKLDEIEKEAKLSSKTIHEVLNKNLSNFDPKLRGRIKVLKTISSIGRNTVERVENEMEKVFPIPEVLIRMQLRDEKRKKRWDTIRERKKIIEEEKEKIRLEKEEEQKLAEEEEKMRRVMEEREERRLRKESEEERKRERQKLRQQLKLAQAHYHMRLVKTYGLDPWKRLISDKNQQTMQAQQHSTTRILQTHLRAWRTLVYEENMMKNHKADRNYKKTLMRNVFMGWVELCNDSIKQYQAAVDFADMRLAERALVEWLQYVQDERLVYWEKDQLAVTSYNRQILTKCLKAWKTLPNIMSFEREKEERKRKWRQKVQEVLPDYKPLISQ